MSNHDNDRQAVNILPQPKKEESEPLLPATVSGGGDCVNSLHNRPFIVSTRPNTSNTSVSTMASKQSGAQSHARGRPSLVFRSVSQTVRGNVSNQSMNSNAATAGGSSYKNSLCAQPIIKSKVLPTRSTSQVTFAQPTKPANDVIVRECQQKLRRAKEELKALQVRVVDSETKASQKQCELQSKLEGLESELAQLLNGNQEVQRKQSWLSSLAEIEEKGNMARDKLTIALQENEKLWYQNAKLRAEQKEFRQQIETLQLKYTESKSDRKKYKILLKGSESRETDLKNQLEKAKQVLLNLENGNGFKLAAKDIDRIIKGSKKQVNASTTGKPRQLREKQSASHIITITPLQSQTTITTIFKPIPSLPDTRQSQRNEKPTPVSPVTSEVNVGESIQQGKCEEKDSTEALLRDLFFPFAT